jgi:predicted DsbA family dithiol-disulfide isomerase
MTANVDTESTARLSFQYWSDPMCIWAFVGQSKLDRILDEWGAFIDVDYRLVPVFGSVPWRYSEGGWAQAGPEGRRESTRKLAEQHGIDGVTGEIWTRCTPHSSWSSGAAAKAVFEMEADDDAEAGAGAAYLLELREHFFRRNRNICQRVEQLDVAERVGIDRGAFERRLDDGSALACLWEDANQREDLGVRGSPSYVFDGGRAVLYGNFPFSVLHSVVDELINGLELGGSGC